MAHPAAATSCRAQRTAARTPPGPAPLHTAPWPAPPSAPCRPPAAPARPWAHEALTGSALRDVGLLQNRQQQSTGLVPAQSRTVRDCSMLPGFRGKTQGTVAWPPSTVSAICNRCRQAGGAPEEVLVGEPEAGSHRLQRAPGQRCLSAGGPGGGRSGQEADGAVLRLRLWLRFGHLQVPPDNFVRASPAYSHT